MPANPPETHDRIAPPIRRAAGRVRGAGVALRGALRKPSARDRGCVPERSDLKPAERTEGTQGLLHAPYLLGCGRSLSYIYLLLFVFLGLAFLLGCFRMWNGDIWWHLRTGQLILERGRVPGTDWFTYTGPEREWIDLHWGFQVAAAGAYAMGGVPLLVVLKAALGTLAIGLALLARRRGWPLELTILAWLPPLFVLSGRLYVRPEIFTLVFLASYLTVLFHAEHRPRWLWLLPALQLLWVNSQGLFAFGPVVLGFYWLDRAVWGRTARRDLSESLQDSSLQTLHLVAATLGVLLACLINPYFVRGTLFPLELFRKLSVDKAFYGTHIMELQSAGAFLRQHGLSNPYLVLHLVTLGLGAASFVVLGIGRRFPLFRLLLFVAFGYLGWQATRNNNHFALVAGYVTAWNFGEVWEVFSRRRVNPKFEPGAPADKHVKSELEAPATGQVTRGARFRSRLVTAGRFGLLGVLLLLGWLVVSNRFYDWVGEGRRFGLGERNDWYVHDAARFVGRTGMPHRVFVANLGQAGVVLFQNGPEQRVFIDARLEVNSRETFERYLRILDLMAAGDPAWTSLAGAPGDVSLESPAVLLDRRTAAPAIQGMLTMPGWRLVHADRVATVFLPVETAERLQLPRVSIERLRTPDGA